MSPHQSLTLNIREYGKDLTKGLIRQVKIFWTILVLSFQVLKNSIWLDNGSSRVVDCRQQDNQVNGQYNTYVKRRESRLRQSKTAFIPFILTGLVLKNASEVLRRPKK